MSRRGVPPGAGHPFDAAPDRPYLVQDMYRAGRLHWARARTDIRLSRYLP
jgi:hypothetical protein